MSSMAATLAGLQPAPAAASTPTPAQAAAAASAARRGAQSSHIPARYEEALDVEGEIPINDVELNGTALLKILKHSTDPSPVAGHVAAAAAHHRNERETGYAPTDAMGLLLGLDLSGTAEVADCFALPTGSGGSGANGVGALLDGEKSESESRSMCAKTLR
jgi:translation initiation factor 3 subunit H